jgi:hypothetical protein
MRFSHATPPPFPIATPPHVIDETLVQRAHEVLADVVGRYPVSLMVDKATRDDVFAVPMARLCAEARLRHLPVERLIVAIKLAWKKLPERRIHLGDVATDVLSSAVSVCIEQYFADPERRRNR